MKSNNAIITYELFEDIKFSLRKQWAGFMYESITKNQTIPVSSLYKVIEKIERVENQIRSLVDSQVNEQDNKSKVTFDISKLANELGFEEFTKIKDEIHEKILNLLFVYEGFLENEYKARVIFRSPISSENIEKWFISLENVVKQYKWTKNISSSIVFRGLGVKFVYFKNQTEVPFDLILSFYSICTTVKESFAKEDYEALLILLSNEFNKQFQPEPESAKDDLPF